MSLENNPFKTGSISSQKENDLRNDFLSLFKQCPIPENKIMSNLGLFIKRQDLSRILFMNELYKKIIDIHGVIIVFGVRWGKDLALLESFRGIYEPFNHNRKIVGFDTFEGYPTISEKDSHDSFLGQDRQSDIVQTGSLSVTEGYVKYLEAILDYHEKESPISHIKKYELIKGDAIKTIEEYFEKTPETIVAFVYFDFDVYEPTKKCLEVIKKYVTKGTVLGFDELNYHHYPGVTIALKEVFGLNRYKIVRTQYSPLQSYITID